MHAFLIPLVYGAVLVFAVLGVGKLTLWLLGLRTLPWHWRVAFVAVLGQATVNLLVQALLLSGGSSAPRLRILAWVAIVVGSVGHLLAEKTVAGQRYPDLFRTNGFLKALLITIWVINLAVALAPSSKIDEIHYHMLVPKRIAADGTMNFYRLPIEAAIVPQMQYQISSLLAVWRTYRARLPDLSRKACSRGTKLDCTDCYCSLANVSDLLCASVFGGSPRNHD